MHISFRVKKELFQRNVIENTKFVFITILQSGASKNGYIKHNFKSSQKRYNKSKGMVNFVDPLALPKSTIPKEFWSCHTNCIVLEDLSNSGLGDRSED